ncbi:hypothetical protein V8C86DRAFT_2599010 [Haematococcus lacustris]
MQGADLRHELPEPQALTEPAAQTHIDGSETVCFICLDSGTTDNPLAVCCGCAARPVHVRCMARWQLQAAGKLEEVTCRFCLQKLPDWRSSLTPVSLKPVTPVMAIKFEGRTYKLRVQPGPAGLRQFKEQVRTLLGFEVTEDFDVSFECQVPSTGEKLKLTGLNSYGAATHCAAITAAEREAVRPHRDATGKAKAGGASSTRCLHSPTAYTSLAPLTSQQPAFTIPASHSSSSSSSRLHGVDAPTPPVTMPASSNSCLLRTMRSRSSTSLNTYASPSQPVRPISHRTLLPASQGPHSAASPSSSVSSPFSITTTASSATSDAECWAPRQPAVSLPPVAAVGSASSAPGSPAPDAHPHAQGRVKLPMLATARLLAQKTVGKLMSTWDQLSHGACHRSRA